MYIYRREDNGELIEVDFQIMMTQDSAGYIEIMVPDTNAGSSNEHPTGRHIVKAKRCVQLEIERNGKSKSQSDSCTEQINSLRQEAPIVSDALGFAEHQHSEFEYDRERHGFHGVEFIRDPQVPQFFRVKFSSRTEWERYVRHRGMFDKNSRNGGGQPLDENSLKFAQERIIEKYGNPKKNNPAS